MPWRLVSPRSEGCRMKHTRAPRWRRRGLPAGIGGSRVSAAAFPLLTALPRLGDVGLELFRGEEPRPPGMVRDRLVLLLSLADRGQFGVELLAVGASLLHFPWMYSSSLMLASSEPSKAFTTRAFVPCWKYLGLRPFGYWTQGW